MHTNVACDALFHQTCTCGRNTQARMHARARHPQLLMSSRQGLWLSSQLWRPIGVIVCVCVCVRVCVFLVQMFRAAATHVLHANMTTVLFT